MHTIRRAALVLAVGALLGAPAVAQSRKPTGSAATQRPAAAAKERTARAELRNAAGKAAGTVTMTQTPAGVLIVAELRNLPPGVHGFHVHETGRCEAPFKTAGGHYNPTRKQHGIRNPAGKHAGDLPNIHVPPGGRLKLEVLAADLALDDKLFDKDGAAVLVHATADDYASDPAGHAGDRIACGVIR